jgi:xylulokinase
VHNQPLIDPQGEVAAFCDSTNRWLPLACSMNATVVTEAVRNHYGWDHDRMEKEVASAPMGSEGLMMLPYFQGERTPSLPDGCGVLHGLNISNFKKSNIMRAAMEGVSLSLGYGMLRLCELGFEPTSVKVTGGGAKSPVWRQIISDVFGLPLVKLKTDEGAALGAALQAAVVFFRHSGEDLSYEEIISYAVSPDPDTMCEPDETRHAFYQDLLARQQYLVETLHIQGFL